MDRKVTTLSEIPKWHYSMLNDTVRNTAFQTAIADRVTATDRVVDIGTGTGLLSILAARAGARSVDAFEAHPDMAGVAARTIAASGVADRIVLHRTMSINVSMLRDDRRDFLLTEIFDCALIGEGILPALRHARAALLSDDYRSIPQAATLHGALLSAPRIRQLNEVSRACGVDVSGLNHLQTKGHFPVRLATWPHALVSDAQALLHLDMLEEPPAQAGWNVAFTAEADAPVDGLVAWFDMDLGAGRHITTHPAAESHWMQAFVPFPEPVAVRRGERVDVRLAVVDDVALTAVPDRAFTTDLRQLDTHRSLTLHQNDLVPTRPVLEASAS